MREVGWLRSIMSETAGDCLMLGECCLFSEGLQPRSVRDWSYCMKQDSFLKKEQWSYLRLCDYAALKSVVFYTFTVK